MDAKSTKNLTLADHASRIDPNGVIPQIIELMSETNEILDDMVWQEGNLPTGHKSIVRTGLPDVAWRDFYEGVQPSKSKTKPVTDTCGMLEGYSNVDKDLASLNGNTPQFRLSEDSAFIEAMNQEVAETLFYGDTSKGAGFLGFAPRFNDPKADTWKQVIDAGGRGATNTSIWIMVWGDRFIHGIYPKGSKAGLQTRDLGESTVKDADGGEYQALRTHFQWKPGLVVRDWRQIVCIRNLDTAQLAQVGTAGYAGPNLINLMIRAINKLHNTNGRCAIYCNQSVKTALDIMAQDKHNVNLSVDDYAGKPVTKFRGFPIRRVDQILDTEEAIF